MKIVILILVAAILTALWIRLAPSSVAKWHDAPIDAAAPKRLGYLTEVEFAAAATDVMQALDLIALVTPRTVVLAGSANEGRITYITRTKWLGAPDYTTITADNMNEGSRLTIYGRLRFGLDDQGVNRNRIKSWLKVLESLQ